MNDVATTEQQGTDIAPTSSGADPAAIFKMVMSAAKDPDINAEKMKILADLANSQQDREAERRFRMAKQLALLDMPSISKHGAILNKQGGVQSRYSTFEEMNKVVKPILAKRNLTISFNVDHQGQMITVQPLLGYADGELAFEERGGQMVLAVDTTGSKNATQGAGSAASYGKRHAMKAMLNIIEEGEDNDGGTVELPPAKTELIDEARAKATEGTDKYGAYFDALSKEDKGFLAYAVGSSGKTYHEANKEAAKLYD